MLIVGAGGHAKEILDIFYQKGEYKGIYFYDDFNSHIPDFLFDEFKIIKSFEEVKNIFNIDNKFILGIGNPILRYKMFQKFSAIGGSIVSIISPSSQIGHFNVNLGRGLNIMNGVKLTINIIIGDGSLLNSNCSIHHDSLIGKFCEISPGVIITGKCSIGDFCTIGTGAVVIPKVKIGRNSVIGAGSVVIDDIEENSVAVGVPAKIIKKLNPLSL